MAKDAQTEIRIIAGLDIGTTKVTCAIGRFENGQLDIIGVGNAPNTGMRHGVVVNIDSTSESIRKAKEEAELMAGVRIEGVWLGVGGQHIQSFASAGMVAVRHKEVRQEDIDRVIEAAKAVAIPQDRQVLHVLPQDFKIDGQIGIFDPVGMSGVRLEASVFIVTGSIPVIQNAVKCARDIGGTVIAWERFFSGEVPEAVAVNFATHARGILLDEATIKSMKPAFVCDISLPANTQRSDVQAFGAEYFGLDEITAFMATEQARYIQLSFEMDTKIEKSLAQVALDWKFHNSSGLLTETVQRSEVVLSTFIKELESELGGLSTEQKSHVEALTRKLAKRLTHSHLESIKALLKQS